MEAPVGVGPVVTFPSRRDPAVTYHVTFPGPVCDCPGFVEWRHCSHVRDVLAAVDAAKGCPRCGAPVYRERARAGIPKALLDGRDYVRTADVIACSCCEWAEERHG